MIKRLFNALPGPLAARILQSLVIVAVLLTALFFFYEWLGSTFLDTGGGFE
ncbi:MAG: hypothetical protein HKN01_05470 [Acidimicrobiia bacterium]|nr:hypothetical protein [Acidimicrobiia bacterium]NNK92415.1 hypothetical protein [Acidimicrobiia bacterium]